MFPLTESQTHYCNASNCFRTMLKSYNCLLPRCIHPVRFGLRKVEAGIFVDAQAQWGAGRRRVENWSAGSTNGKLIRGGETDVHLVTNSQLCIIDYWHSSFSNKTSPLPLFLLWGTNLKRQERFSDTRQKLPGWIVQIITMTANVKIDGTRQWLRAA